MKSKTYAMVFCLFVLTLGAGVMAGVLAARLPGSPTPDSGTPANPTDQQTSPLAEELQLTPEQEAQIKPIWEDVSVTAHDCLESARKIQKQRDDAVVALLSDDQKAKYNQISADFIGRFTDLNDKREQAFQAAVQKTMQLLDTAQRDRYRKIIQDRTGRLETDTLPTSAP